MKNFLSTSLKITFFLIFANFATVFAYFESGITEMECHFQESDFSMLYYLSHSHFT